MGSQSKYSCLSRLWWSGAAGLSGGFDWDWNAESPLFWRSFRISLMNELLNQYHSHRRASQAAALAVKDIPLAKDHYLERAGTDRDCVVCSHRPQKRVSTSFVCHVCQVHLCIGPCFGQYHAKLEACSLRTHRFYFICRFASGDIDIN
jgi:hypothetical protein